MEQGICGKWGYASHLTHIRGTLGVMKKN